MGGGDVSVTRWVWEVMGQCYQMDVGGDEINVMRWGWEVMRSVLPDGCGR